MKAYIINTGSLMNDINLTYAHAVQAKRSDPNPPAQWLEVPTYAVLIDHPEAGWILYDLGSHEKSNEIWPESTVDGCYYVPKEGATMTEQLAVLGLKPSDINYVIMSHMHMDHIGNMQLFKDTAEFYVSRAEAANAFLTVCSSPDRTKHGFYNKPDVLAEVKALHYVDEDCELFPGIESIILPGHTPGTMGLIVHLDSKTIILTSDALNGRRNYNGQLPGVIADSVSFFKSLEKIKKLEKKYDAEIWFAHDMEQFNTFKKVPEFYA